MSKQREDAEREDRITMEIVVDAYNESERAMGWYCYLERQIQFPFTAVCVAKRPTSPLRLKDKVEVVGMLDGDECEREMFVTIRWKDGDLGVPLSQLEPVRGTDEVTTEAVEDWHYWVSMGYQF